MYVDKIGIFEIQLSYQSTRCELNFHCGNRSIVSVCASIDVNSDLSLLNFLFIAS